MVSINEDTKFRIEDLPFDMKEFFKMKTGDLTLLKCELQQGLLPNHTFSISLCPTEKSFNHRIIWLYHLFTVFLDCPVKGPVLAFQVLYLLNLKKMSLRQIAFSLPSIRYIFNWIPLLNRRLDFISLKVPYNSIILRLYEAFIGGLLSRT